MKFPTLVNLFVLFCSLFFFFLTVEIIARTVLDPVPYSDQNLTTSSLNELLGWEFKSNSTGYIFGKKVSLNSEGFRDQEFELNKSNESYRIAIVGDSLTFGYGIEGHQSYPELLERNLNLRSSEITYEVFNFGVPGYTTVQEAELISSQVLFYLPDLIIIGFYYNDYDLSYTHGTSSPFSSLVERWFWHHSRFYQYIKYNFKNVETFSVIFNSLFTSKEFDSYLNPSSLEYNSFVTALDKIDLTTSSKAIPVVFLLHPHLTDARPYPLVELYNLTTALAEERNFLVLDLFPYFQHQEASDLRLDSIYDWHPNEHYYNLTAEIVYGFLKSEDFIE